MPDDTSESAVDKYRNAWDALGKMLANGRSLSGRERNCCFLNTGEESSRFADISALSGFDFPDDLRGLAVSDWDRDGDLDVWSTNRTAPRVRFLRNDFDAKKRSVSLRLQGRGSNRDGIGSRVELVLDSGEHKLVRTLRAGEGYLGQSSKWLHFGLGSSVDVKQAVVLWPSGRRETFRDVMVGGRFTLVEGTGKAALEEVSQTTTVVAPNHSTIPDVNSKTVRIVLPARLPMPDLTYRDLQGEERQPTAGVATPLLINLWATWCQPCLQEINEWSQSGKALTESGVKVLLLCVDEATGENPASVSAIEQLLEQLGPHFSSGLATPELLDGLDIAQQVLTKRVRPMPVPTSFLVDAKGRLAVVYKGPTEPKQLLLDISELATPPDKHRDLAAAFPGSWYTNPFPVDLLAIPERFLEVGQPVRALRYLQRNSSTRTYDLGAESSGRRDFEERLSSFCVGLAKDFQQRGNQDEVVESLQLAAQLQPNDAKPKLALALIFQDTGRPLEAATQYRNILKLKPGDPVVANNLAWLLSTSADPTTRRPDEAIRLAELVCEKSRRQLPSALDTLAAAYAAAGRYDEAVTTINEALSLLESNSPNRQSAPLRQRLSLYQKKRPFVNTGGKPD